MNISEFIGKTFTTIVGNKERLTFYEDTGAEYLMWHSQDCCECVTLEDVVGELEWLTMTPILQAEESTNRTDPHPDATSGHFPESYTWTYYRLGTIKGYVTLRWFGESNGWYSESVDIDQIKEAA